MTKIKMLGMTVLALAMAVLFVGCGKNNSGDTKPQEPVSGAVEAVPVTEETSLEASSFLGWWEDVTDDRQYYHFGEDNGYQSGIKETGMITPGTWQLKGNAISLEFDVSSMEDSEPVYETVNVAVKIIDKDTLELTFPKSTVKVKRFKPDWL